MTRGRCGSLFHIRMTFAFTTPRRFNRRTRSKTMTSKLNIRRITSGLLPIIALVFGGALAATSQTSAPRNVKNIVLIHGGFVDGSGWEGVYNALKKKGYNITIVQNPTISLADDVAVTKRVIAAQDGPVILVGHSYGGVVITEAGTDPKVVGLVYVAAFAPDSGESVETLIKEFPPAPGGAEVRPDSAGFLKITTKGVVESFAQDLPMQERRVLAATQGPTNAAVFGGKVANAAWKAKPTWYVVATNDRMIQPDLERKFAAAMKAKTI